MLKKWSSKAKYIHAHKIYIIRNSISISTVHFIVSNYLIVKKKVSAFILVLIKIFLNYLLTIVSWNTFVFGKTFFKKIDVTVYCLEFRWKFSKWRWPQAHLWAATCKPPARPDAPTPALFCSCRVFVWARAGGLPTVRPGPFESVQSSLMGKCRW